MNVIDSLFVYSVFIMCYYKHFSVLRCLDFEKLTTKIRVDTPIMGH